MKQRAEDDTFPSHWYCALYTQDLLAAGLYKNLSGGQGWRFHAVHIITESKFNSMPIAPSSGTIFPFGNSALHFVILLE